MHAKIIFFVSLILAAYATAPLDPCLVKRKCTTTGETVYAIDEHHCYLFPNQCLYENFYCQRKEECKPVPRVVSRYYCLTQCNSDCTKEYKPVCGQYNNTLKTFPNKCNFLSTSCQNDQAFLYVGDGECGTV